MARPERSHESAGFFYVRTPLLPFDRLLRFLEADSGLAERLRALCESPAIREAIRIGSAELLARIDVEPFADQPRALELAVLKYFTRMAVRPTPFGVLAGCSFGTIGAKCEIVLAPATTYRRDTRVDVAFLADVCARALRQPGIRRALVYRINPTLWYSGRRWRYIDYAPAGGGARGYQLSTLGATPALDLVVAASGHGTISFDALSARLRQAFDVDAASADGFIEQLIDNCVLLSELDPSVTGSDSGRRALEVLSRAAPAAPETEILRSAIAFADEWNATPVGTKSDLRLDAVEQPFDRVLQTDMYKPVENATLSTADVAELYAATIALHRIVDPPRRPALRTFIERFSSRYGDCEMPLLEVLDDESGIGFGDYEYADPECADVRWPGRANADAPETDPLPPAVTQRALAAIAFGRMEIRVDESDFRPTPARPLPDTFAVVASAGDRALVYHSLFAPAFRVLGRFCGGDPQLDSAVRTLAAREERRYPDALFAEVTHIPDDRIGNVLRRPLLREWEIPLFATPAAHPDRQILPRDLVVSIVAGRVRLRSKSRDREVVPRLASAHYFGTHDNLTIYRFLCAVQEQGCSDLAWVWGRTIERSPFLPRVVYRRTVLSRARWRLDRDQVSRIAAIRADLRLPRWVSIVDGDRQLTIDLESPLGIELLRDAARGEKDVFLAEVLPEVDDLIVRSEEGRFTNEIVVPFLSANAVSAERLLPLPPRRVHRPGSAWVYAKTYCGGGSDADAIITGIVAPLMRSLLESGAIDRWFFLRYADPEPHIRLRARAVGESTIVLARVAAALGDAGRLQFDTYEPEVGRYGGDEGVDVAERIFQHDSECVAAVLEEHGTDLPRWQLAMIGVDRLLDDAGLSADARIGFLRRAADDHFAAGNVDAATRKQLSSRLRDRREMLAAMLADSDLLAHFDARSRAVRPLLRDVMERRGIGAVSSHALLASYVHMHVNRVLRGSHARGEMIVYDSLARVLQYRMHSANAPASPRAGRAAARLHSPE